MALRSPATPTSKSLRDRIAKFEGAGDSKGPKSPVTRSPVSPRIPKATTQARSPIKNPSTTTLRATPDVASAALKPPPTPPSAFSSSSNESGTVEYVDEEEKAVALETIPLTQSDPSEMPGKSEQVDVSAPALSSTMGSPPAEGDGAAKDESEQLALNTSSQGQTQTATVSSARSPLDDLLSPVALSDTGQEVAAAATEEAEDDEGDVRFSMVPLSGKTFDNEGKVMPSSAFSSGTPSPAVEDMGQLVDIDITNTALQSKDRLENIASPRALFFKNRLEKQEDSGDMNIGSNKQFQEEFTKIQNQRLNVSTEEEAGNIDWDFWGAVMSDYHQFARENADQLATAIEQGIPSSLRGMMWQLMAASKDPDLESEYARLLKEASTHEKAITRDLGRTFPHHDFFQDGQGIGQENLFNVLKAYSLYDPEVGYCQGLPFVVAVLLLNMPDEEAFCLLVRLMTTYGLRGHFLPEMPALQLRLFQFDRLVEELLPVLHVHFLRQGVKSSMYCSQWFLTMFSYRFPLDVVFRIYDNVLATGIEAIFGFSIALLQKNEEKLLKLKFDDILDFLRNKLFDAYEIQLEGQEPAYLADLFVRDAAMVRITPFMLDAYAHEYEDSVREREAHAVEMDNLRNINRNLSAQIKTLEASLAQLNTEHCEIVKQLVMSRLANEELEGELVRYKLLYADLMHQSEDAGSSHRLSTLTPSRR